MNTPALTVPVTTVNRRAPLAVTAEIMCTLRRAPVAFTIGVRPTGAPVVPAWSSRRMLASSAT